MAEPIVITVAAYNFGFDIPFALLDADGTAYDVTDFDSLTFFVWKYRDVNDNILTGTVDVDTAALGLCHYTVVEHDFDIAGSYLCIVQGLEAAGGGKRISWGPATLNVMAVPHT